VADAVVIDLGQDWSIVDDDRPDRRGSVRRLLVALVAVLTVVLTGGAEPVRRAFVSLAEVPINEAAVIALSPDRALVADRADSVVAGRTWHGVVAAYALPGGAPRWRTPIPEVPQELRFVPGARVVFAATHHGGTGAVQTVALDAGTGRLLWSSTSAGFAHAPAGSAQGLLFDQTAVGEAVVRWADLRTGRTIWSRALPADGGVQMIYGATLSDPVWVLLTTLDGAAELLAEQTGAVLDVGRLGGRRPPGAQAGGGVPDDSNRAQGMPAQVNVVGGRVLVLRPHDQRSATLAAFDLATLAAQWTLTGDFDGYPNVCGPMVCLSGTDALTAIDPATGAVAWHTNQWQQVGPMIDHDHLLAEAHQPGMTMGVLDTRTGRLLMRISGWTPIYDTATARIRLLVRPDTRQYGRFWFTTLDPSHGTPTLLGYLPRVVSQDCQTAGDLLACHTLRRTVQIWRYRTT
jgi:hypothetical protein